MATITLSSTDLQTAGAAGSSSSSSITPSPIVLAQGATSSNHHYQVPSSMQQLYNIGSSSSGVNYNYPIPTLAAAAAGASIPYQIPSQQQQQLLNYMLASGMYHYQPMHGGSGFAPIALQQGQKQQQQSFVSATREASPEVTPRIHDSLLSAADYALHGSSSSGDQAQNQQPQRRACDKCRKHHKACNGEKPCDRCIQNGWGDQCTYEQPKRKRGRKTRAERLAMQQQQQQQQQQPQSQMATAESSASASKKRPRSSSSSPQHLSTSDIVAAAISQKQHQHQQHPNKDNSSTSGSSSESDESEDEYNSDDDELALRIADDDVNGEDDIIQPPASKRQRLTQTPPPLQITLSQDQQQQQQQPPVSAPVGTSRRAKTLAEIIDEEGDFLLTPSAATPEAEKEKQQQQQPSQAAADHQQEAAQRRQVTINDIYHTLCQHIVTPYLRAMRKSSSRFASNEECAYALYQFLRDARVPDEFKFGLQQNALDAAFKYVDYMQQQKQQKNSWLYRILHEENRAETDAIAHLMDRLDRPVALSNMQQCGDMISLPISQFFQILNWYRKQEEQQYA